MVTALLEQVSGVAWREWLLEQYRASGMRSLSGFAEKLGVTHRTFFGWLEAGKDPSYTMVIRVADALGLPVEEVERAAAPVPEPSAHESGTESPVQRPADEGRLPARDTVPWVKLVPIPIVERIAVAGGGGWRQVGQYLVPEDEAPGRDLVGIRVVGDCMAPEILSGDLAIVDRSNLSPRSGSRVVVETDEDEVMVKVVDDDPQFGRVLRDNVGGSYRPNGARVLGELVGIFRRMRR